MIPPVGCDTRITPEEFFPRPQNNCEPPRLASHLIGLVLYCWQDTLPALGALPCILHTSPQSVFSITLKKHVLILFSFQKIKKLSLEEFTKLVSAEDIFELRTAYFQSHWSVQSLTLALHLAQPLLHCCFLSFSPWYFLPLHLSPPTLALAQGLARAFNLSTSVEHM